MIAPVGWALTNCRFAGYNRMFTGCRACSSNGEARSARGACPAEAREVGPARATKGLPSVARRTGSAGEGGRLAQLVEHRLYTPAVTGSSPVPPTNHQIREFGGLVTGDLVIEFERLIGDRLIGLVELVMVSAVTSTDGTSPNHKITKSQDSGFPRRGW